MGGYRLLSTLNAPDKVCDFPKAPGCLLADFLDAAWPALRRLPCESLLRLDHGDVYRERSGGGESRRRAVTRA